MVKDIYSYIYTLAQKLLKSFDPVNNNLNKKSIWDKDVAPKDKTNANTQIKNHGMIDVVCGASKKNRRFNNILFINVAPSSIYVSLATV